MITFRIRHEDELHFGGTHYTGPGGSIIFVATVTPVVNKGHNGDVPGGYVIFFLSLAS